MSLKRKLNQYEKKGREVIKPYGKEVKNIKGLVESSILGVGGSLAIGSLGGSVATAGQKGITNAFSMHQTIGGIVGKSIMMGSMKQLEDISYKKRKKRR